MKMRFWCGAVLILTTVYASALNITELSKLAVITGDDDDDVQKVTTELTALATTDQSYRYSRWQRHESRYAHDDYQEEEVEDVPPPHHHHDDDVGNTKAVGSKVEYWGGYYDFLINEGSYKFWAVFQLATAALLIYSGFAALYYAKVNPAISDDYDDFMLRRRRRRRSIGRYRPPPRERPYYGLDPQIFQIILDAIAQEFY